MVTLNTLEFIAIIKLMSIEINPLSIMNLMLMIGLFSEFYCHCISAFIHNDTKVNLTCRMLMIPLLVSSMSTMLSVLPMVFHEIKVIYKLFCATIIAGQLLLLCNTFVVLPILLKSFESTQ
jgi:hypothetical protein